ncbi:MAG: response regulator [Draconibacterium sp.]|nr:response regulator [Draconibacterium sp.]
MKNIKLNCNDDIKTEIRNMKRILLAEDNKLILETVAHSLTKEGYEIIKAIDGKECLELLEDNEVDLIITDLYMPNVNGMEVISFLRDERRITTPIMVLSAAGDEENVLKAFEFGADDFMIKPFSLVEINIRVKKLLAQKR